MKILLVSDLHVDHDFDSGRFFLNKLFQTIGDVLVIAGDWASQFNLDITRDVFDRAAGHYESVLVVTGNHEVWWSKPRAANTAMRRIANRYPNIHLFEKPGQIELGGVLFVAGTMWYPRAPANLPQDFNDYNEVQCKKEWFWNQHKLFLREFCKIPDASIGRHKKFVVVTHHMPSTKSSDPQFLTSPYNHYFVTNMERWILQKGPNLWLHGHGHYPADYMIGGTRVVCNPRGYPFEWKKQPPYTPKIIEI